MDRLKCLDGLRGLLAVYVLLGHMAPFAALPGWLQDILSHGGAAVDVFFILSGMVITQTLLRTGGQPRPFLIARAIRIFPVFLPVFALAVVVEPWSCGFDQMPWVGADSAARTICVMAWPHHWLPEMLAHLTMTQGLFPDFILKDVWVSFLGAAWSLSTEWQFYFLALLVVGGFQRLGRQRGRWDVAACDGAAARGPVDRAGPGGAAMLTMAADPVTSQRLLRPQALCWVLIGLAAAGVAWRLSVPPEWQFSRAFLPNKGHFFALGVASVAVARREDGALWRYGLVLAATAVICATQETLGKMLPPLVWTVCLAVEMLPRHRASRLPGWVLRSQLAQFLGTISYCLYLVNEPIHKLIALGLSHLAGGDAMLFTLVWVPAAIGLPVLAAIWLHIYVEAPALRWGRSLAKRSMR